MKNIKTQSVDVIPAIWIYLLQRWTENYFPIAHSRTSFGINILQKVGNFPLGPDHVSPQRIIECTSIFQSLASRLRSKRLEWFNFEYVFFLNLTRTLAKSISACFEDLLWYTTEGAAEDARHVGVDKGNQKHGEALFQRNQIPKLPGNPSHVQDLVTYKIYIYIYRERERERENRSQI